MEKDTPAISLWWHQWMTHNQLTADRSVKFNNEFVKSSEQGHFMLALNADNVLRKTLHRALQHTQPTILHSW